MDSALRPREIQQRIRSGQSLDEVARAAGVPTEKVEPFAVPVLAERAHVAGVALSSAVRRRGEPHGHRSLRQAVADRLLHHGVDADTVEWDAWRGTDRRWTVRGEFTAEDTAREALFLFDLAGRFSTAINDDARWLLGEATAATARDDDSDELALVRAVSDEGPAAADDPEPADADAARDDERVAADGARSPAASAPTPTGGPVAPTPTGGPVAATPRPDEDERTPAVPHNAARTGLRPQARSGATPQEIGEEVEAELDAIDVIPEGRSELDVLYDMLGGINEDSINVYAGLELPVVDDEAPRDDAEAEQATADQDEAAGSDEHADGAAPQRGPAGTPQGDGVPTRHDGPQTSDPAGTTPPSEAAAVARALDDADPPARQRRPRARQEPAAPPAEPEQPSLVDDVEDAPAPPRPARRPRKKGRASVPSWDEIMFGGPTKPTDG